MGEQIHVSGDELPGREQQRFVGAGAEGARTLSARSDKEFCGHGVYDYGKTLLSTMCLDFRRCVVCGVTQYKDQWEKWGAAC